MRKRVSIRDGRAGGYGWEKVEGLVRGEGWVKGRVYWLMVGKGKGYMLRVGKGRRIMC